MMSRDRVDALLAMIRQAKTLDDLVELDLRASSEGLHDSDRKRVEVLLNQQLQSFADNQSKG